MHRFTHLVQRNGFRATRKTRADAPAPKTLPKPPAVHKIREVREKPVQSVVKKGAKVLPVRPVKNCLSRQ